MEGEDEPADPEEEGRSGNFRSNEFYALLRVLGTISLEIETYVSDRDSWLVTPHHPLLGREDLRRRKLEIIREFDAVKTYVISEGYIVRGEKTVFVDAQTSRREDDITLANAFARSVRYVNETFGTSRLGDEPRSPVLFPPSDESSFEEMVKKLTR